MKNLFLKTLFEGVRRWTLVLLLLYMMFPLILTGIIKKNEFLIVFYGNQAQDWIKLHFLMISFHLRTYKVRSWGSVKPPLINLKCHTLSWSSADALSHYGRNCWQPKGLYTLTQMCINNIFQTHLFLMQPLTATT